MYYTYIHTWRHTCFLLLVELDAQALLFMHWPGCIWYLCLNLCSNPPLCVQCTCSPAGELVMKAMQASLCGLIAPDVGSTARFQAHLL